MFFELLEQVNVFFLLGFSTQSSTRRPIYVIYGSYPNAPKFGARIRILGEDKGIETYKNNALVECTHSQ
jgi:hypothetical protein